jgi:hypothetical protein
VKLSDYGFQIADGSTNEELKSCSPFAVRRWLEELRIKNLRIEN